MLINRMKGDLILCHTDNLFTLHKGNMIRGSIKQP